MRMTQIQVEDSLQRLADHALATGITHTELCRALDKRYLIAALDLHEGNQTQTANFLRIHRNTLSRRLRLAKIDMNGRKRQLHRKEVHESTFTAV